MKKFAPLMIAAGFAVALIGCSKDRTCTCTYNNGINDTTEVIMYTDVSKSDAETACDLQGSLLLLVDASASCTLD